MKLTTKTILLSTILGLFLSGTASADKNADSFVLNSSISTPSNIHFSAVPRLSLIQDTELFVYTGILESDGIDARKTSLIHNIEIPANTITGDPLYFDSND